MLLLGAPVLIAYGAIALRLMRFLPTMVSPFYIGVAGILFVFPVTVFQTNPYSYLKDFSVTAWVYLVVSGILVAL